MILYPDKTLLALLVLLSTDVMAEGKSITFSNSSPHTRLVELYTSQGCSSCPPAEKWLNRLDQHKDLWKTVFPLALHVTYWDYLGWKDPHSDKQYTDRQRSFADAGLIRSVYTPCFIVNGKEWRGWFSGQKFPASQTSSGELQGIYKGDNLQVTYSQSRQINTGLDLYVSISGSDLKTKIARGENQGLTVKEKFVALFFEKYSTTDGKWSVRVPFKKRSPSARYALSIWVTKKGELIPLQAAGGWF